MENKTQEIISPTALVLGNALTRVRGELNMNQEDFGRFLGVSRMTISFWELGKAKPLRATLSRVKTKLQPYLAVEELAIFESIPMADIVKPTSEDK